MRLSQAHHPNVVNMLTPISIVLHLDILQNWSLIFSDCASDPGRSFPKVANPDHVANLELSQTTVGVMTGFLLLLPFSKTRAHVWP